MRQHVLTLLLALIAVEGGAQQAEPAVTRGQLSAGAAMDVSVGYDDNVFRSATDERSSWVSRIDPEIFLAFSPSTYDFSFHYSGEYSDYKQAERADYRDHSMQGDASMPFLRRGQLGLTVARHDEHDDFGAGLTEGLPAELLPDEPDRFTSTIYAARAAYGKEESTLRVALEVGRQNQAYKNNLARTRFFDREEKYAAGQVGFRVSPKVSLVLDLTTTAIDYDRVERLDSGRDSREHEYRLGVEWQASEVTSVAVSGGYLRKHFDDLASSGPVWDVFVDWSPRDGMRFEFGSQRTAEEATTLTAFAIDTTVHSMGWRQVWPRRLVSGVVVSRSDRKFVDGGRAPSEDLLQIGIELTYDARGWLIWALGLSWDAERSTIQLSDYHRRLISIGAKARF